MRFLVVFTKTVEVIAMCLFSFDKEKYEKTIKNKGIKFSFALVIKQ